MFTKNKFGRFHFEIFNPLCTLTEALPFSVFGIIVHNIEKHNTNKWISVSLAIHVQNPFKSSNCECVDQEKGWRAKGNADNNVLWTYAHSFWSPSSKHNIMTSIYRNAKHHSIEWRKQLLKAENRKYTVSFSSQPLANVDRLMYLFSCFIVQNTCPNIYGAKIAAIPWFKWINH